MSSPQPITCGSCGGRGVTEQTRYSVITKPDGTQEAQVEQYAAACTACGGSGRTY